jgi:chemotaxis protein MotB
MNSDTRKHTRVPPSFVALGLLGFCGCVAQPKYDAAQSEIKYYQRDNQDLRSALAALESENKRLELDLENYKSAGTVESQAVKGIDERIEELRAMAAGLGVAEGDVTVLSVEGGYGLRVGEALLFDSGSETLRPEGRELLNKLAQEIATRPYGRIWVRGHSDSDPVKKPDTVARFPHGNLQLSAARAIEVAVLLGAAGGLDPARVVVAGFGPNEPVERNDSAEHKQMNRRVEIFVIEDEEPNPGLRSGK